jgi:putative endonuclease
MKGYVYLLLSVKDLRTYLGSTPDLDRRLKEHNMGNNLSTRNRRPFTLIYSEKYETLNQARIREHYLKTKNGRRKLKKILGSLNTGE